MTIRPAMDESGIPSRRLRILAVYLLDRPAFPATLANYFRRLAAD
jgi:hypothetical protein